MIDHFAVLGFPRRPWLDPEAVKNRFHELSATLHPDVPGTGDAGHFTALNAAQATLSDPAARLRHLLELEAPGLAPAAAPPAALGDLFMRHAALHQRAAAWRAQRAAAAHPLARALLASETETLRRDAEAVQSVLDTLQGEFARELCALDAHWEERRDGTSEKVAELQARLAFAGKWQAQLRNLFFDLRTA